MNRPTTSHLQASQASATGSQRFRSYKTRHLFVKSSRIRTFMVSLTKCHSWSVGLAWDSKSFECKFCDLTFTPFRPNQKTTLDSCSIRKNNQMIPPTLAETKAHSIAWEQPRPHDHNQQQLIATTLLFETCSSEVSAPRSTYIEYMAGKQGKHPKGTNMKYWSGNDVKNFGYIYIYYKHAYSIWFMKFGRHFRIMDTNLPRLGKYKARTDVQCTSGY